jgi:histone acetyltransferase (RNA polymerase elongator complex component)
MKNKAHGNIAIFVPHAGCPHRCSFCDQRKISAAQTVPTVEQVQQICQAAVTNPNRPQTLEIAFFGGSFTAIPEAQQTALLEAVQPFVGCGAVSGIRISTRPDAITPAILARLQRYHVTAIELGAQSMVDSVLERNRRGHTAQDVRTAAQQIKADGFSLGLQMMVGLYGSTIEMESATLQALLALQPDTMRIYPLSVLSGTELAERVQDGSFSLYSMETVLDFCADALCACDAVGVNVIRCGLHAEETLQSEAIAGFYHPAFRELVESRLCLRCLQQQLQRHPQETDWQVQTAKGWSSRVAGHHGSNRAACRAHGVQLHITETADLPAGWLRIGEDQYHVFQIAGTARL